MTGTSVVVGNLADFPPGSFRLLTVAGSEIGIYNVRDTFYAVRNLCPHRGAPVCMGLQTGTMLPSEPGKFEWALDGQVIRCPWHRWEFDLTTGRTLFGVDRRRLIMYEVSVEGSQVLLQLGETERKHLAESGKGEQT